MDGADDDLTADSITPKTTSMLSWLPKERREVEKAVSDEQETQKAEMVNH